MLDTSTFDKFFGGGEDERLLPRGARFIVSDVSKLPEDNNITLVKVSYFDKYLTPEERNL